jgi:hypothetical protein
VWRNTQGQAVATGTGADGDFNGQITSADYNVWRSHFGQMAGSGASISGEGFGFGTNVPEPAATVLVIGCFLGILRLDRHIFRLKPAKFILVTCLFGGCGYTTTVRRICARPACDV